MSRIYNYTVHANVPWVSTNLKLDGTQPVRFEASSGRWTANPGLGMVGAAGHAGFAAKPGYLLPGAAEGLLVGYIGPTEPPSDAAPPGVFAIGASASFPSPAAGYLYLSSNDDIERRYGAGFSDNHGTIHVKVTVG